MSSNLQGVSAAALGLFFNPSVTPWREVVEIGLIQSEGLLRQVGRKALLVPQTSQKANTCLELRHSRVNR
jgi:hypothetical protein